MTEKAAEELLDEHAIAVFHRAKAVKDMVSSAFAGETISGDGVPVTVAALTETAPQFHPSESFEDEQSYELYKQAKNAAMDLLARREYSFGELTERLKKRFVKCDEEQRSSHHQLILSALQSLQQDGLQSDRRFVESYIHSRINRNHGWRRIQQDLYPKRVSSYLIEEVLQELDIDWFSIAAECYQRKYAESVIADAKEYTKRARFMAYRGHDASVVNELLTAYKRF
ncbi:SOS response regulatory protein OraA/RecX [Sinobacterium caligoides]|uniref:Regulatory protein RecX n=1 Tax=Sinobacterium caligoides TaxID=933926 RepID=A0A3N2DZW1_9GAMM|nr:regulatory protein RecX [Sinobacterium caligoides]ROS04855.1 SOS response regulatory protein OraA/RecX [Sinobacterium caligoides]